MGTLSCVTLYGNIHFISIILLSSSSLMCSIRKIYTLFHTHFTIPHHPYHHRIHHYHVVHIYINNIITALLTVSTTCTNESIVCIYHFLYWYYIHWKQQQQRYTCTI